jgi:hypothetical protein
LERSYLAQMLQLILNAVVAQSMSPEAALVDELELSLQEQDVPKEVTSQVLSWFGIVTGNHWQACLPDIAREIGVDLLRSHQDEGIDADEFLRKWGNAVGEPFAHANELKLLEVLCQPPEMALPDSVTGQLCPARTRHRCCTRPGLSTFLISADRPWPIFQRPFPGQVALATG